MEKIRLIEYYKLTTVYILSALYILIGYKHFHDPNYFIGIIPDFIPLKVFVCYLTGLMEIVGGVMLLIPKYRKNGAYLLILLLIIVFPSNIYLYVSETPREVIGITKHQALVRMPFQLFLIILAYWHSLARPSKFIDCLSIIIFPPTIIYFLTI